MVLIDATQINDLLKTRGAVLVDARGGPDAQARFLIEHLSGARFINLETDLSQVIDPAKGGRHPLPSIEKFGVVLGKLGISKSTPVIVYDDKRGANAAARFWWMLKAAGQREVYVINGGLESAKKIIPVTSEVTSFPSAETYHFNQWKSPTVDIGEVTKASSDEDYLIIDVRENFRYRGESEPIDLVAGHIPNAVNIFYQENLDADGKFLSSEQLTEKYSKVIGNHDPNKVIVHCGSGVTACHTLLAMAHAGIEEPKLYVGSWSEWSRNEKPIAKG